MRHRHHAGLFLALFLVFASLTIGLELLSHIGALLVIGLLVYIVGRRLRQRRLTAHQRRRNAMPGPQSGPWVYRAQCEPYEPYNDATGSHGYDAGTVSDTDNHSEPSGPWPGDQEYDAGSSRAESRESTMRDTMINEPMSGVHDLFSRDD